MTTAIRNKSFIQKFKYLLFLLSIITSISINAQFYEYGQEPASINWLKLDSPHFRIIYPSEIGDEAIKVMTLLEKSYKSNSAQLNHEPKKIPVILHAHGVRSNGFVVWAPKRMEIFMFPDANSISQDWYSHLSIHELRHVIQIDKMNKGLTKALGFLLGEMSLGPAAGLSPFWLLEGDAVYAETSLSESGRGRLPEFEMGIKAHLLSNDKNWSYSKSYLGSDKDFVPNYYHSGYQMVSYAREKYGNDIWSGAFDHIGKKPYQINPLYFYLKQETGGGKNSLYKETMLHLKKHWEKELAKQDIQKYSFYNKRKNNKYISYKYPQILKDTSIIAIKSGYHIIDRFVKISPDGKEETLFIPGYMNSGRLSLTSNKLIWDEFQPSARWKNVSYSIIKEYNLTTGEERNIGGYKTRYTSPSYSPSGDSIITVQTTISNKFFLVFLSSKNSQILSKVPSPDNKQIMHPVWQKGSNKIIMTALDHSGKSIISYDRSEDKWGVVFPSSPFNINDLSCTKNHLIFHSDFEGRDNIFAIRFADKQLFKISSSKFGAFQPSLDNNLNILSFSDYSPQGYNIVKKEIQEKDFKKFIITDSISEQAFFSYNDHKKSNNQDSVINKIPVSKAQKYSRLGNLFHLHSWAPFYYDFNDPSIENPDVFPGISLLSQNLLSTAVSNISYEYRKGEHYLHSGFTYKAWLPVFNFSYSYGGNPDIIRFEDKEPPAEILKANTYNLLTYIPLSMVDGKWNYGVQPSLRLKYSSDYFYSDSESAYKRGISYLTSRLYLYTFQKTSFQDLIPRWGIVADLQNKSTPFEEEQLGNINAVKLSAYVPGIIRGHGIRLKGEFQNQNFKRYAFSNTLLFPRGYEEVGGKKLTKYSFDYYLTLMYPDLNIEGILYLKKISAQLFSDYMYGEDFRFYNEAGEPEYKTGSFQSFGAEIRFEYHAFRILFPFISGVRFSYLQNYGSWNTEAIFSINLNRF